MYHQVKAQFYYVFWGIATVSVVIGQLYVGTGYRSMVNAIEEVGEKITQVK